MRPVLAPLIQTGRAALVPARNMHVKGSPKQGFPKFPCLGGFTPKLWGRPRHPAGAALFVSLNISDGEVQNSRSELPSFQAPSWADGNCAREIRSRLSNPVSNRKNSA